MKYTEDSYKTKCDELDLEYIGTHKHSHKGIMIEFVCKEHRDKGIQSADWSHFKSYKIGCSYCSGRHKTNADIIPLIKNEDVEIISEYIGNEKPMTCKCRKCGNIWTTVTKVLTTNGSGCPMCNMSNGEKEMLLALDRLEIDYETQYSPNGCTYKKNLKFDAFDIKNNIAFEYNGEQHYKPVYFAGRGEEWAKKQFEINRTRDQIKIDYCKENNIKMIIVPYWEKADMESFISKKLKKEI